MAKATDRASELFVNADRAAQFLGISPSTIRNMANKGTIGSIRVGNRRVFRREDIDRLIAKLEKAEARKGGRT